MTASHYTEKACRYRLPMRILILGASGFIGSALALHLVARGHHVTGVARDVEAASRRWPAVKWRRADIARMTQAADWTGLLAGHDAVVNCAGALQDGARDDLAALQDRAMRAMYDAARKASHIIVQISARTDAAGADTPFLATKRAADRALAASGLPYVIFRPAVVVGRNAHGGSALLRALASLPFFTPLVDADAPMRFVAMEDVVEAVADALEGRIATGSDIDLASPETLTLAEAVGVHRAWLGLGPAPVVALPSFVGRFVALFADALGHLGWRSPLRSTALTVAAGGVTGHAPAAARPMRNLVDTLTTHPSGVQDLWFAGLYFLKPLLFSCLSLFWTLSGLIALLHFDASSALLVTAGATPGLAAAITAATSLADILLGLAVIVRRWAVRALQGMVVLSLAYLAGATLFAPSLWLDPLGPLVKVLPSILLACAACAIFEER